MKTAEHSQSGFTLIEVLVALVISSLLLAIIFDGASSARRRARSAEDRRLAVLLGDNLLSNAAAKMGDADLKGMTDGLSWTVSETSLANDARNMFALVSDTVIISDKNQHQLFAGELRRIKAIAAP